MPKLTFDISTSLDGYVAGPDPRPDQPLGRGGEQLHEWIFGLASWREAHGRDGGEANADDEVVRERLGRNGAGIMGRGMFGGGPGPWDESWKGWWGDEPPFDYPVFVLTHHPRERLSFPNGSSFTFVTDGIESALEQARAVAGEKDVHIGGGASVAQQYLNAGLLDEVELHVVPVILGGGTRLLEDLDPERKLEIDRVIASPAVTHLRYRVTG
ncbi:MAG TPA: dihydrofolate reductase family protein [Thermoleophilaceae bacterium]|jgi:dihydrofolate reductase